MSTICRFAVVCDLAIFSGDFLHALVRGLPMLFARTLSVKVQRCFIHCVLALAGLASPFGHEACAKRCRCIYLQCFAEGVGLQSSSSGRPLV